MKSGSSFSGSRSSLFFDEGFHDFGEEYVLLDMDLEVEFWILSKSANEAVSCKKGCRSGNFMNFRYEGFPYWKSVNISESFTKAPFDSFHIFNFLNQVRALQLMWSTSICLSRTVFTQGRFRCSSKKGRNSIVQANGIRRQCPNKR